MTKLGSPRGPLWLKVECSRAGNVGFVPAKRVARNDGPALLSAVAVWTEDFIAAAFAGLSDRIEVVATDTTNLADAIFAHNPLGKIPALTLANGETYFDSRVIVEYFDYLAGGGVLIPAAPEDKFKTLALAALADGIADACLLQVYERRLRAVEKQDPNWLAWQEGKVTRGLSALEKAPPAGKRTIAHIGAACALGYLDLRFAGTWRADHPNLVKWLEDFSAEVPVYGATSLL